ncbi:hypothetical protein EV360DRAFT_74141 [Lentinula raphanica]|nr:hypothetical protein EV360DRAFT_74141 [Lentinula raphanica]
MSSSSPSKKLRLKTYFFRGSSNGPSCTSSSGSSSSITENLSSSSTFPSEKRSSRIPFEGRSRKKSIHSDADADTSVSNDTKESRASVATAVSNSQVTHDQHGGPFTSIPHASTSQHSLKAIATSTSFGSKIAAHLVPSKLQRHKFQGGVAEKSQKLPDYMSDSLPVPSLVPRSPSIESNVSRVSRLSTPRASQAQENSHPQLTITVSRPPVDDDFDELAQFHDLFTKPRHKVKSSATIKGDPNSTYQSCSSFHKPSSTSSSTPPSAPMFMVSGSTSTRAAEGISSDIPRRKEAKVQKLLQKSAGDSDRASLSGASVSSFHDIPTQRKASIASQQNIDIDTADESEPLSIRSAMSMPASFRNRSLMTSNSLSGGSTKSRISRMTLPSKPPSIPLPATPLSGDISSSLLSSQTARQRAHTIAHSHTSSNLEHSSDSASSNNAASSNQNPSLSRASTIQIHSEDSNSSRSSSSTPTMTKTFLKSVFDIDTATTEELREALRSCNQQYEDITDRLLQLTETHVAEKRTWEQKLVALEGELLKKGQELTALARLVGATPLSSRTSSFAELERESESYAYSTLEWGSGTSGAEDETQMAPIKPNRMMMRKLKLVDSVNKTLLAAHSMPLRQTGSGLAHDLSENDPSFSRKRSSASSSSSTPPDYSPTSLVFPASHILNPIPESCLAGEPRENHVTFSAGEPKRERKFSGQPSAAGGHTILSSSVPSVTPGSRLTPSEAYIMDSKKGRPPSIAQILDQDDKMNRTTASNVNIEESYEGRSRALLAGTNPTNK